jgi:glycosyltransferase involved in cell wall biosynthesis
MIASVIVCTHNPTFDYINRTLQALKEQSLNFNKWELLIIDNASKIPVAKSVDVSWHPAGRHIHEEKLGSAPARIRGITEAKGDLIVFVDDDNCLQADYLDIIVNKMDAMPMLGAVGSGNIFPEFEKEPTAEELPFLRSLAIRNESHAYFSNEVKYHKAMPFGAGLCIRRTIALAYVKTCLSCPVATTLGRVGKTLLSGEDIDLVLHACRDGYITGVLPELKLIHLIPKVRLEHNYLVNIAAGHAASSYLLSQIWNYEGFPENSLIKWGRYWKKRIKSKGLARRILIAEYEAEKAAKIKWEALTEKPKSRFLIKNQA